MRQAAAARLPFLVQCFQKFQKFFKIKNVQIIKIPKKENNSLPGQEVKLEEIFENLAKYLYII